MNRTFNFILIGSVFILFGLTLLIISLSMIPMTDEVVSGTILALHQGAPISLFQYYVNGLLSGGYISIIPNWLVYSLSIMSLIFIYLGIYLVINRKKENPFSYLISKKYWNNFQKGFQYKAPVVVKKRN